VTELEHRNGQRERATSSILLFWRFSRLFPHERASSWSLSDYPYRARLRISASRKQMFRAGYQTACFKFNVIYRNDPREVFSQFNTSDSAPVVFPAMIRRGGASGMNSVRDGVALSHSGSDDKPSECAIIAPYVVPIRPLCSGFHFITSHCFSHVDTE
jgi:hypothetical protein